MAQILQSKQDDDDCLVRQDTIDFYFSDTAADDPRAPWDRFTQQMVCSLLGNVWDSTELSEAFVWGPPGNASGDCYFTTDMSCTSDHLLSARRSGPPEHALVALLW